MNSPSLPKILSFAIAWAFVLPSAVHAESVLERVLGQIDGASNASQITGVYANIAESLQITGVETVSSDTILTSADPGVRVFRIDGFWVTVGDLGTTIPASVTGFYDDVSVAADGTVTIVNATDLITGDSYTVSDVTLTTIQTITDTGGSAATIGGGEIVFSDGTNSFLAAAVVGVGEGWDKVLEEKSVAVPLSSVIDGSITNVVSGLTEVTAEALILAGSATEFSLPTIDIGDITVTALGAVNTGDITVGVSAAIDEAATSATKALQASMGIVGGSAGAGTMMLNIAHNTSVIQGNVSNTLVAVDASVGNISITALGAVNTGTITNGAKAVVQGIVGMSGRAAF